MINTVAYTKMSGLGNQILVVDWQDRVAPFPAPWVIAMANPQTGPGFDQLMLLRAPRTGGSDLFMEIFNADGSEAQACGNGTRCVAKYIADRRYKESIVLETKVALIDCVVDGELISADLGRVKLDWQSIPLSHEMDVAQVDLGIKGLPKAVAVNMGNPNCILFVPDVDAIDLNMLGPIIEHHSLFPRRTNVEFAQVMDRNHIRMRVWERGAGITQACGSGASATVVAGVMRNLCDRQTVVSMPGGDLHIDYLRDGHVVQRGPAEYVSTGEWSVPQHS